MTLTKKAEWIKPFLEAARPLVPKIRYLRSLDFRKPRKGAVNHAHGITHLDTWNNIYDIVIHSHAVRVLSRKPLKVTYTPFTLIESLECLAHELAHLRHFKHTPAHKILECKIKAKFMCMIKLHGYKSDEDYKFKFYLPPH